jgi:hypothetical protein
MLVVLLSNFLASLGVNCICERGERKFDFSLLMQFSISMKFVTLCSTVSGWFW